MGSAQPSQSPCSSLARAFRLRSCSLPASRFPPLRLPFFFFAGVSPSASAVAAADVAVAAAAAVDGGITGGV